MNQEKKLATVILLMVILCSAYATFIFIQILRQSNKENSWDEWAEVAWRYYTPGVGVDSQTLLHRANTAWHRFTSWDLGSYIQSLIDADRLKIIKTAPFFAQRVEAILKFLERNELSPNGFPYWSYSSGTGEPNKESGETNPADIGRLLLALSTLRTYRPELTSRINAIVARLNLTRFLDKMGLEGGFYGYFAAQGFQAFGFGSNKAVNRSLEEMARLSKVPHVDIYGEQLPLSWITSEPILHTLLELPRLKDSLFQKYAAATYKVQELRFRATGKYTAFSEGSYFAHGNYIFEWIIRGDSGATWTVTRISEGKVETLNIAPVVYTKAAFAFHALHSSEYTRKLVDWLLARTEIITSSGFMEGVTEANELVSYTTDKTNAMILSAATYAIDKTGRPGHDLVAETKPPQLVPTSQLTSDSRSTYYAHMQIPLELSLSLIPKERPFHLQANTR